METALVIGFNALFFTLIIWFFNRQFNNIDKRFDRLEADYKELKNELKADYKSLEERLTSDNKNLEERLTSDNKNLEERLTSDYKRLTSDYKSLEERLTSDNKEIRNQVYNHIPSQIREVEKSSQERDKRIEDKLDRLIEGIKLPRK